jgi:uncharacterized protein YpiB (UPF0302 family)
VAVTTETCNSMSNFLEQDRLWFRDACNIADYMAPEDRMMDDLQFGKYSEGRRRGPFKVIS